MLLQNKNAIIYGAGGSIGAAVAAAFAEEGAKVYMTGRNILSVQKAADLILSRGGNIQVDQVDALDEVQVENHLNKVIQQSGTIDISFNAIGYEVVQDIPLVEMKMADFVNPVATAMQTQFLTATAAGRKMMKQKQGVILSLTATPGGIGYPYTGGFGPVCCATECFSRNLAAELGSYGVRVVNIRSGGSPDSKVFQDAINTQPDIMKTVLKKMEADTMLKKLPAMVDIARVAVFLSSHMAAMITGVTIDVTSGTTSGLNYRTSN